MPKYEFARPGIEDMPWGTRDMVIADSFENRIIFFEESAPLLEELK